MFQGKEATLNLSDVTKVSGFKHAEEAVLAEYMG